MHVCVPIANKSPVFSKLADAAKFRDPNLMTVMLAYFRQLRLLEPCPHSSSNIFWLWCFNYVGGASSAFGSLGPNEYSFVWAQCSTREFTRQAEHHNLAVFRLVLA